MTVTSLGKAGCACWIVAALVVGGPARGAPANETPATDVSEAQAKSRASFRAGLEAFERDQVATAIARWNEAHAVLIDVPELEDARHVIELALGQAHVRSYDLDHDRAHLRIARPFIASYLEWTGREGHELTEAEQEDRPRALTLLARIDILLQPAPKPRPAEPTREALGEPPPDEGQRRSSAAMMAGGGAALGLAAIALAGTFGGFGTAQVARRDYERSALAMEREEEPRDQGRLDRLIATNKRGVILGAMSVIVFVAGTAVGVPLLVKGLRTRQRIRADVAVARGSAHAQLRIAF